MINGDALEVLKNTDYITHINTNIHLWLHALHLSSCFDSSNVISVKKSEHRILQVMFGLAMIVVQGAKTKHIDHAICSITLEVLVSVNKMQLVCPIVFSKFRTRSQTFSSTFVINCMAQRYMIETTSFAERNVLISISTK